MCAPTFSASGARFMRCSADAARSPAPPSWIQSGPSDGTNRSRSPRSRARWSACCEGALRKIRSGASSRPQTSPSCLALWRTRLRERRPPRFQRLTFRPGQIVSARFLSDGRSAAYDARWEDGTSSAHVITPSTGDTRDLAVPKGAGLAAFSRTGELALFLSSPHPRGWMLARRGVPGSPPRELVDGVRQADWGPDGESLAIVRMVDANERIEFP